MQDVQNYYEVLEIAETATQAEIKTAFRLLAQQYHPDKVPEHLTKLRQDAEERFKQIEEAYTCLSDSQKRSQYDEMLRQIREEAAGSSYESASPPSSSEQQPAPETTSRAGQSAKAHRANFTMMLPAWLLVSLAIAFCYWTYLFIANRIHSNGQSTQVVERPVTTRTHSNGQGTQAVRSESKSLAPIVSKAESETLARENGLRQAEQRKEALNRLFRERGRQAADANNFCDYQLTVSGELSAVRQAVDKVLASESLRLGQAMYDNAENGMVAICTQPRIVGAMRLLSRAGAGKRSIILAMGLLSEKEVLIMFKFLDYRFSNTVLYRNGVYSESSFIRANSAQLSDLAATFKELLEKELNSVSVGAQPNDVQFTFDSSNLRGREVSGESKAASLARGSELLKSLCASDNDLKDVPSRNVTYNKPSSVVWAAILDALRQQGDRDASIDREAGIIVTRQSYHRLGWLSESYDRYAIVLQPIPGNGTIMFYRILSRYPHTELQSRAGTTLVPRSEAEINETAQGFCRNIEKALSN